MKVGLIPPWGLENFALRSQFHLTLALPLLMRRRTYAGMYTRASELGDFVVLDNGIAEGQPCEWDVLRSYAVQVKASEVVAPDVLRDDNETLRLIKEYFKGKFSPVGHMAVAQGSKMQEFIRCVNNFAEIPKICTVGIPRHMLQTLEVRSCRIDLANWIESNYPKRFDIHFLGTNPYWLAEIKHATKYAPHVRSVDTSMPFSYAIEGETLSTTRRRIIRPRGYFTTDWSRRVDVKLIRQNIATLLEWANATGTRSHEEASSSEVRTVSAI